MICTRKAVKVFVLFIRRINFYVLKSIVTKYSNTFNIKLPKSFGVGGNTKTSSSAVGLQNISFSLVDYNIINSLEIFPDWDHNNTLKIFHSNF